MPVSLLQLLFFISILSTTIILIKSTHAYIQCLDDQKALLLELKNDLIFDPSLSTKLVQWNKTDDCCKWYGVECDGPGHVINLQLEFEAISGRLETSSSLFSLTYLKKLNLAFNNFNGTQIPRGIGNLTDLTHLKLSYAAFGGQIPIELSLLTRLVSLDISNSYFPSFDQKSVISTYFTDKPLDLKLMDLMDNDIRNSYFPGEVVEVQFPDESEIQPLKVEDPSLKILLQNLTSLGELYLDSVEISSPRSEWCHAISSSLPELRNLSLRACNLSGPPDPSLLQLKSLSVLQLDWNNLSTTVPDFLSNFSSLTTLSFKECYLKGSLSEEIFQIPTLQKLDLSYNELRRSIPATVANLTELVHLDLSNNLFTGFVPSFYMCKKLRHVDLSENSVTGSLSSVHFDGLSDLEYIDLSRNNLTGSLSSILFQGLSHLKVLDLGHNSLSGTIPRSLFGLPSLKKLMLDNNLFNGNFQLENIRRLRYLINLDLSYNYLSVDARNNNNSLSTFPQLSWLGLASCNLHSFPDLRNQSYLEFLDLSNNKITGKIPNWIWETGFRVYLNLSCNLLMNIQTPYKIPSSLQVLDLHSNLLHGEFPLPIQSDTNCSLVIFSLANNSLTGAIPYSLCNHTCLQILDLSFNIFSGDILPCLVENNEDLKVLNLNNNNLGGKIPKSLKNCKSLVTLNVGNNNISDSFPCMLPSSLRLLVLRSNKFHGGVRCRESWPYLQIIDIAFNNFSGNLDPLSFSSWRGMMSDSHAELMRSEPYYVLRGRTNYYPSEVTLVIKGHGLKEVKIWEDFAFIDFSSNNFQGTIPSAIGDLNSLDYLNLSHNDLTGSIPKSFGRLRQLESLDLSVNQLTGVIPMEIAGLTFLALLNLSHNMLVGKIPTGPQIQTFSADSFEGNMGLCGLPLNLSCSNTHENGTLPPKLGNVQSHGTMEIEWNYVSAALGCVVGLGGFVWVLLCCQSLSRRYFEKVDEILEKIFDCGDRRRGTHGRRRRR